MTHNERPSFTMVLHSHIPYVLNHGRWPHGTDWLNEATAGSYIPLLNVLNRLVDEGISPKLTLGITPVLAEQFADAGFRTEFSSYLRNKIEVAEENAREFEHSGMEEMNALAESWQTHFTELQHAFEDRYGGDLVGAFKALQDEGHIEILTSAATHGYFPLLSEDVSIDAQIKCGVSAYQRHFGRAPRGLWPPELAYRPEYEWTPPVSHPKRKGSYPRKGVERLLSENRIEYFLIDTPLLKGGKSIGVYLARFKALQQLWEQFEAQYQPREQIEKSPYRPYLVGGGAEITPVAIFTRDSEIGLQVWSGEWGYPGDAWYLDFHKKHFPGGHRYWRVISSKADLADKEIYNPQMARERVVENASHFVHLAAEILNQRGPQDEPGILVAPFDTELFGHWWFEGVEFLYLVLKQLGEREEVTLVTCGEYLDRYPPNEIVALPEGSWGEGGFHWIWLNEWTEWTWERIYDAEVEMIDLAGEYAGIPDGTLQEILKQAGRELLLLQASDWQFLISTWSARDYAEMRFSRHYEDFERLARMARTYQETGNLDAGDRGFLEECMDRDRVFSDVNPAWWAPDE
ncbi:MAG: 1,4-alpha-glucan branching protein domain-containing protein [Candidatus Bipolaricaulia bacterium]